MAASILFYGIPLSQAWKKKGKWATIYETHGYSQKRLTKTQSRDKGKRVPFPPFGCVVVVVVGKEQAWVAIKESCILVTGSEARVFGGFQVGRNWKKRLKRFCEFFEIDPSEAGWIVACIPDDLHKKNQLLIL